MYLPQTKSAWDFLNGYIFREFFVIGTEYSVEYCILSINILCFLALWRERARDAIKVTVHYVMCVWALLWEECAHIILSAWSKQRTQVIASYSERPATADKIHQIFWTNIFFGIFVIGTEYSLKVVRYILNFMAVWRGRDLGECTICNVSAAIFRKFL